MNEVNVKLIEVIQVDVCRGKGVEESPYRRVIQYFTKQGVFLAEHDHFQEQSPSPSKSEREGDE